jgi:SpoVK/Ycf46/Vps4 family AAA+-type ATPase
MAALEPKYVSDFRSLYLAAALGDPSFPIAPYLSSDNGDNRRAVSAWVDTNKDALKIAVARPAVRNLLVWIRGQGISSSSLTDCAKPTTDLAKWKDIKGADYEKQQFELNYIYPFNYPLLFPVLPKGILMYGPPGTGKTLMVKAATTQLSNVAFFAPTTGELRGKYEGETEKNIQKVFTCANQLLQQDSSYTAAVIFIDEIDSVGGKRGDDPGMTRSVNALLQAMDGINSMPNVSVIAATNYPWSLDPALLRRFTSRIFMDMPTYGAVYAILIEGISKNYGDPWEMLKSKLCPMSKTENPLLIMKALDHIDKYGTSNIAEKITGASIGSISNPFAVPGRKDLVTLLGPSTVGLKIKSEILAGTKIDMRDPRLDARGIFGYSASDVRNVINLAVQKASRRALAGYAIVMEVEGHQFWVHVCDDCDSREEQTKVSTISGMSRLTAAEQSECGVATDIPDRDRVVTFDIRMSDFKEAIREYPPTIDNRSYVKLLMYSRGLYAPE